MKLILVSLLLCLAAAPALARRPARCQVTNTPLHLYNRHSSQVLPMLQVTPAGRQPARVCRGRVRQLRPGLQGRERPAAGAAGQGPPLARAVRSPQAQGNKQAVKPRLQSLKDQ